MCILSVGDNMKHEFVSNLARLVASIIMWKLLNNNQRKKEREEVAEREKDRGKKRGRDVDRKL